MAGKRVRKRKRKGALGVLGYVTLLAIATALAVPLVSHAVSKPPRETPAEQLAAQGQELPDQDEKLPAEGESLSQEESEPQPWGQRLPSVSANDPELWETAWNPTIPLTAAVEDSWFADAAFLGDSRTEGFQLFSGLKEGAYYHSVGATVESVFSKATWGSKGSKVPLLDAMAAANPARIYVMLGVNELGWVKSERFYEQYGRVVDRLRADHPDAEIILQSVLPVSAEQEARHTYVNNGRIEEYNTLIRRLAEEKRCWYLDVGQAVMGEDGCLRAELTPDGVHLNKAGCKIWLEVLRTHTV